VLPGPKKSKFTTPDWSSSSDSDSSMLSGKNDSNSDSSDSCYSKIKKFKIPKNSEKGRKSKETIKKLREDLPNLNHHSDEIFQSLSWSDLFKLDNKLESHGKGGKKLTDKMAKNLEKIKKNPKKIEKGLDNRADIIHDSRFLGGHICKNSDIWLKAREKIGIFGLEPISRYDSEGLGMNGNINSHIWATLHNPGSKDFSIKMLSPEALSSARSANEKDANTCKKDFVNINDIRLALNTIRTATQLIHPWNLSSATLEYFLNSVQFGEKESTGNFEKVKFVTKFIDEVLANNAEAWDDSKPFMSSNKISNKWVADMMTKGPKTFQKNEQNKNYKKIEIQDGNKPNMFKRINIPPYMCRRFNFNICPNQNDASCGAPWNAALKLKHLCAFQNPDKSLCLKNHSYRDHK